MAELDWIIESIDQIYFLAVSQSKERAFFRNSYNWIFVVVSFYRESQKTWDIPFFSLFFALL